MTGDQPDTHASEAVALGQATVFVSYSREDQQFAKRVITLLEEAGFNVWWDGQLKPGVTYVETTEEALESAEVVVVLWSKVSIASNWVRDEAMSGRERNCLVPVSIDGSIAPLGFRQFQAIDFSGWQGKMSEPVAQDLLQSVGNFHGRAVEMPTAPASGHAVSRRTILAGAGAAIAAAIGGWAVWQSDSFLGAGTDNSIAVLPFRNLSGDPSEDYFAAGLAEELRVTLSLNPQLLVAAEASTRIFEEAGRGLDAIGEQLGVSYVLEGGVRRTADQLRVTARLVDLSTGFDVWSEVFERSLEDTPELQNDLATNVIDELFASRDLGIPITERPGGTHDSEALDHFMRGLSQFRTGSEESEYETALGELESAIDRDPSYAVGHAIYGWCLMLFGAMYISGDGLAEYRRRASEHARRAITLAPTAPEGHAALGLILYNALDLRAAREPYQTSYELGFGNAPTLAAFGQFSAMTSDFDVGRAAMQRAKRIDPLNAQTARASTIVEFSARDFARAQEEAQAALSLNADITSVYSVLGDIALLEGEPERARAHFEREPSALARLPGLAMVDNLLSGREAGQERLEELVARYGQGSLYQQAEVFASWGETEAALEALEAGLALKDPGIAWSGVSPWFDPIRQEPRFEAIQVAVGL